MDIVLFNAKGQEIWRVPRIKKARWSLQGRSDEKQLTAARNAFPNAVRAEIGSAKFEFELGGKPVKVECCCDYPPERPRPDGTTVESSECPHHGEKAKPEAWGLKRPS